MKPSVIAVVSVVAMMAVMLADGAAQGAIVWGVTNGTNDTFSSGGQIFTVDTATGNVVVKASYTKAATGIELFGDIAVRSNGEVYVTYRTNASYPTDWSFVHLAKVNTSSWAFDWTQNLYTAEQGNNSGVNALEFISGELYGVQGGMGAPSNVANLIKFALTGGGATPTNLGSLGTNSVGDITTGPDGRIYYTSFETTPTNELNVVTLNPLSKTGKEIATGGGTDWAGLVGADGKLWAGRCYDGGANSGCQKLYTLDYDTSNATYTATQVYDLGGSLGGTITGLSVPEPATMGFLALGGAAALVRRLRRR
jgi:hypothetical protein